MMHELPTGIDEDRARSNSTPITPQTYSITVQQELEVKTIIEKAKKRTREDFGKIYAPKRLGNGT